jgi:DNA polymerase-3 subunit chi
MQIDFYIISEHSQKDSNQLVCQLCEKALEQNLSVFIYTESAEQAYLLDELLWIFKADSFIAHNNLFAQPTMPSSKQRAFQYPVVIGSDLSTEQTIKASQDNQLLINLSSTNLIERCAAITQKFSRIAEVVGKNNNEKAIARDHYRFYQKKGYTLNKYDL